MPAADALTVFDRAAALVRDGDRVGLGSGRAATRFLDALAARAHAGLAVRGFPTSLATARRAAELGIPLLSAGEAAEGLDIAIDGADQFTPAGLDLIKGYGRCALRERIVAGLARRFVILVGPGKRVDRLGAPLAGRPALVPVDVVPFAEPFVARALERLGLAPRPWEVEGRRGVTDDGNHVLDCVTGPIADPAGLDRAIRGLPGVAGTGLFLGMAERVLEGDDSFRLVAEHERAPGRTAEGAAEVSATASTEVSEVSS